VQKGIWAYAANQHKRDGDIGGSDIFARMGREKNTMSKRLAEQKAKRIKRQEDKRERGHR
jgi:hypothetical protein